MKSFVLLLLVIGLFFSTSCKKRAPSTTCYAIFLYDSTWSNIPDLRIQKYAAISGEEHCGWTAALADQYVFTHDINDTTFNHGDSIVVHMQWALCPLY